MEGIPDAVLEEWSQAGQLSFLRHGSGHLETELKPTVDWLMKLAAGPEQRVTVISTNYDIEVEQQLYKELGYDVFNQVDFGTSVREPSTGRVYRRPGNARFGMFKLHGSLNWLRCSVCDNIYINPIGAIAYLSFLLGDDGERHQREIPWLRALDAGGANQCHCGYRPLRHVIVAPSFVRDMRDPILLEAWRNAFEALRRADEWVIVGYSLPPEDVAIRSMFLRAYQGREAGKPRVIAVQREKKEPESTRYDLLFPGHTYVGGGLSAYIGR
jgi:hypothetical protein